MVLKKDIPVNERLIFALDVPDFDQARALVDQLGDAVTFYKIGLELFMAGDYFGFLKELKDRGKRVFVDLKFFDVPNTVASAVRQLEKYGADFATVHGNDTILKAAAKEKGSVKILAVTVLTSIDRSDLKDLGFPEDYDPRDLVLARARRAVELGCDGVISSGLEAKPLRDNVGENFIVITPGIRPVDNDVSDDQKRTVDVEEAFENGADYIVVGRPIKSAPDPRAEAQRYQARIAALFAGA